MVQSYRDLIVWKKAMDFATSVYKATQDWPREESYGLTNQVRRAVASIPANIAEGQGRESDKDFLRFLVIAKGSLHEAETHLLLSERLEYQDAQMLSPLMQQAAEVGRLLNGLIKTLRARSNPNH